VDLSRVTDWNNGQSRCSGAPFPISHPFSQRMPRKRMGTVAVGRPHFKNKLAEFSGFARGELQPLRIAQENRFPSRDSMNSSRDHCDRMRLMVNNVSYSQPRARAGLDCLVHDSRFTFPLRRTKVLLDKGRARQHSFLLPPEVSLLPPLLM
jgi:hypothetical protein